MIESEYEELIESARKMERRLKKEQDQLTREQITTRLNTAQSRIAEIDAADDALHQRAMADHRAAEKERLR